MTLYCIHCYEENPIPARKYIACFSEINTDLCVKHYFEKKFPKIMNEQLLEDNNKQIRLKKNIEERHYKEKIASKAYNVCLHFNFPSKYYEELYEDIQKIDKDIYNLVSHLL